MILWYPILGHPQMEWRIWMWTAKHTSLIGNFSSYMLYFLSVRIRGYSGYNISWGSLLTSLSLQIKISCFHVLCVQEAAPRFHSPVESPTFSSLNCEATPSGFGIPAFSFFRSRSASSALRCSSNLASSSWSEGKRKLEKLFPVGQCQQNCCRPYLSHLSLLILFGCCFLRTAWCVTAELSTLSTVTVNKAAGCTANGTSAGFWSSALSCFGSVSFSSFSSSWILLLCSPTIPLSKIAPRRKLTSQPSPCKSSKYSSNNISASSWFRFNLNSLYKLRTQWLQSAQWILQPKHLKLSKRKVSCLIMICPFLDKPKWGKTHLIARETFFCWFNPHLLLFYLYIARETFYRSKPNV